MDTNILLCYLLLCIGATTVIAWIVIRFVFFYICSTLVSGYYQEETNIHTTSNTSPETDPAETSDISNLHVAAVRALSSPDRQ